MSGPAQIEPSAVIDGVRGPLRLTLDTRAQLAPVRAAIRRWLAQTVDRDGIDDILLATGEAIANAVEHGRPPVDLRMHWSETETLAVTVSDAGEWTISVMRPNRGRGIPIMTALMDNVTVDTLHGTTVRFTRTVHR